MSEIVTPICRRCGSPLPSPDALVCSHCLSPVHADALTQLAAEAKWQAQFDPARAIALWERCLKLLPPDSRQQLTVQAEIDRLRAAPVPQRIAEPGAMQTPKQETLPVAIMKTGVSMLVSIAVYQFSFGWLGAAGFVLLILLHELGHVAANVRYGLSASPPIFIPYLGAVINLRQAPPNARVEAIVGIAGPVAGTLASLICFAVFLGTGNHLMLILSWFGFTMNLFNLLPVPPLDGGRVAAAVSPWFWIAGLGFMGWMLIDEFQSNRGPGILLLVLIFALPRIIKTLKPGGRAGPYYAIGKTAPLVIGAAYLILLALLVLLKSYSESHMHGGGLF